ncbi:hypothetical protein NDU88_008275 [Pleurodeles waltl]|uniref:Uncharacterized protein n=1 Tax=Pleurodeles waltl TaxID=8319 RepID=A0AAV7PPX3_PLEWA|nr:hypothetical protein NDU88_008275 [Pleurodeles waltl]
MSDGPRSRPLSKGSQEAQVEKKREKVQGSHPPEGGHAFPKHGRNARWAPPALLLWNSGSRVALPLSSRPRRLLGLAVVLATASLSFPVRLPFALLRSPVLKKNRRREASDSAPPLPEAQEDWVVHSVLTGQAWQSRTVRPKRTGPWINATTRLKGLAMIAVILLAKLCTRRGPVGKGGLEEKDRKKQTTRVSALLIEAGTGGQGVL